MSIYSWFVIRNKHFYSYIQAFIWNIQTILIGDREQCDREEALEDFKESRVRILIATDVASRGIDVIDITCVLNYDFPRNIEDYVHRVGRTGNLIRRRKKLVI